MINDIKLVKYIPNSFFNNIAPGIYIMACINLKHDYLRIDCYFRTHSENKCIEWGLKIPWSALANLRPGVYTQYQAKDYSYFYYWWYINAISHDSLIYVPIERK